MMMPFNDWRKRKAVALSPKLYSLDEREVTIRTGDWFEKKLMLLKGKSIIPENNRFFARYSGK